jgi:asparagine synthetase B (glutamine-hydrolysing)
MSGIYGFMMQTPATDPALILERMVHAVPLSRLAAKRQWIVHGQNAGLGALRPSATDISFCFARDPSTAITCVVEGVVYGTANGPENDFAEVNAAKTLLRHYTDSGPNCVRNISGSFNVAWWEEKANRLILANDKLATKLLFYAQRGGTFVFASTLARILKAGTFTPEIDLEGFADLLAFKHTFGYRTLFTDVRVLSPATILTFEGGRLRTVRYWRLDEVEAHGAYDDNRLDELEAVFKRAVRRTIQPKRATALALTGGLDSRCIVAAAADQELSYLTYTDGKANSTDMLLAREVAARVGAPHIEGSIDVGRLGEWLEAMVIHQNGLISNFESHTCQSLYTKLPFDAIVSGVSGEPARNVWVSSKDLDIHDLSAAMAVIERRVCSLTARRLDVTALWRPEYRTRISNKPREHLRAILSGYHYQDTHAAACDYFGFEEYTRKYLGKATLIRRATMDSYLPYLDHEWVEAILAIPLSERISKTIQIDIIRKLYPELLHVTYAKTMLPLGASPWRAKVYNGYRRVKRGVLRTLGSQRVPHGESFDYFRWSQAEMRPALVTLLYNQGAAYRKYLLWDTIEPLLDRHFSGQDDWSHLVGALAVFEIAHRLWCDDVPVIDFPRTADIRDENAPSYQDRSKAPFWGGSQIIT